MMRRNVIYISGPQRNMKPGYWLFDFLINDGYNVTSFYMRKDDSERLSKSTIYYRILKAMLYVLFKASKKDLILVYDNDTSGIFLGLVVSVFRPSLFIYKINCMANKTDQLYSKLKKPFVRKAYTHIYTSVNNDTISNLFATFLNLPKSHFIPIPDSISDFGSEISKITNREDHGYIFMGGATQRDYALLINVARQLPQFKFVAVTFEKYKDMFANAPANLNILYSLPEKQFYEVIAHCSVVFIPLTSDLQGGQMVLFQGALLEKPIVTTNNYAIHTYFNDCSVKLFNIGDVNAAISIITELMEDLHLRLIRGKAAYNDIVKYTPELIYQQYKLKLFNTHAN